MVDEAEPRHDELVELFTRLTQRTSPTRIVLTARSDGAWLDALTSEFPLVGAPLRRALPPSTGDQVKISRRTARILAQRLRLPTPALTTVPDNPRWTTLDLVLHGWLIAHGTTNLPDKQSALYDLILNDEFDYWTHNGLYEDGAPLSRDELHLIAAAFSLVAPRGTEQAMEVLERLEPDRYRVKPGPVPSCVNQLVAVLSDPDNGTLTLRPGPVASHAILTAFLQRENTFARVLPNDPMTVPGVDRRDAPAQATQEALIWEQQSQSVCEAITRCADHDPDGALTLAKRALHHRPHLWTNALTTAIRHGGPFATALDHALQTGQPHMPVGEIAARVPHGHTALEDLALAATKLSQPTNPNPEQQAAFLHTLALRLNDAGDHHTALQTITETVTLCRTLTDTNPTVYTPHLAASLNTLAAILREAGDHHAALDASAEATTLYRTLAHDNPTAYLGDLAESISMLATQYDLCHDHHAALCLRAEAATLDQQLPH